MTRNEIDRLTFRVLIISLSLAILYTLLEGFI